MWGHTAGLSPRSMGDTNVPSPITDGQHVFGHSLGHLPPAHHHNGGTYPYNPLVQQCQWHPCPSQESNSDAIQMGYWTHYSCWRTHSSEAERREDPHRAQRKPLGGLSLGQQSSPGHQADVFWDTPLCLLPGEVLRDIISANLLESKIYEVQEVWARRKDLRYAHHVMRDSPKGLWYFCLVSPLELPKVMGLKGIHHPDALCHCAGLSFCPWCGKEGQNEGTVVNHLPDNTLPIGTHMQQVSALPLHYLWGHTASSQRLQTAQGRWCQRGRQGGQWHIHIRLICPQQSPMAGTLSAMAVVMWVP